MKSKALSLLGITALVSVTVFGVAVPASAETTVDDATFYGAIDFGVESGGYPAGNDWFFGDVSGVEGAHTFTNTGLMLNDPATGKVQILNQNVTTPANATELEFLVDDAEVYAQNGDWFFQLAFFAEGTSDTEFTTLRPATAGDANLEPTATWITSQGFDTYSANDTDTLENFATALFNGEAPTLLAYGIFVDTSQTTTINGLYFDDQSSSFGLVPTRTISPNPITPEAFSTPGQGLTLSGTNWFPGDAAYIYIYDEDGNTVYSDETSFIVDSSGKIEAQIVLPSAPDVGTYYVTFDDDGFYFSSDVLDHYVPVPAGGDGDAEGLILTVAEPAPELAATGAEPWPLLAGGILVLLLGGALMLTATRRRGSTR